MNATRVSIVKNVIRNRIFLIMPVVFLSSGLLSMQSTVKADMASVDKMDVSSPKLKSDLATSDKLGKIGGESGSSWTLDSQGVLHIQGGTWEDNVSPSLNIIGGFPLNSLKAVVFEGKVTAGNNLSGLFQGASSLESVTINKSIGGEFNTSKTEDFSSMFNGTSALKKFDMNILEWDSVVYSMLMFNESGIETVDMEGIDAPKLVRSEMMFDGCHNLKNANFDYTVFGNDMDSGSDGVSLEYFLRNCEKLETVSLNGAFTQKMSSSIGMFIGDFSIKSLDISSFQLPYTSRNMLKFNRDGPIEYSKIQFVKLPVLPYDFAKYSGLAKTGLSYDVTKYRGWSNDGLTVYKDVVDVDGFYSENPDAGSVKWTVLDCLSAKYTFEYQEAGITIDTVSGESFVDDRLDSLRNVYGENGKPSKLGYFINNYPDGDKVLSEDSDKNVFVIDVEKAMDVKVNYEIEYGDGHAPEKVTIDVPFGATDFDLSGLDKYSINTTLNPSKSFVVKPGSDPKSFEEISQQVDTSSLKTVFGAISDISSDQDTFRPVSGQELNVFKIHYDKYMTSETGSNGNNNNNSNSNNNGNVGSFLNLVTFIKDIK